MMIRVGLLGRGLAGIVFHAPLIRATEGLELAAIVGKTGVADVIADPAIELIVVATPNDSHFDLALAALNAGKHVVVDKPLATNVSDVDRLIDAAIRNQRILTAFHNRRWDGDFLTVQSLIRSGRLGDILLFEAQWDRFRPQVPGGWKETPGPGSGTLWNLGPHLVDQILMLFGPPDEVQADVASQREGAQTDDYFSLTFHHGKMRAIVGASNLVAAPRPRFAIHGSEGSFVKSGLDPQEARLKAGADPHAVGFGDEPVCHGHLISPNGDYEVLPTVTGSYVDFYTGVVRAIRHGNPAPIDPVDVRLGIQIICEASRHF